MGDQLHCAKVAVSASMLANGACCAIVLRCSGSCYGYGGSLWLWLWQLHFFGNYIFWNGNYIFDAHAHARYAVCSALLGESKIAKCETKLRSTEVAVMCYVPCTMTMTAPYFFLFSIFYCHCWPWPCTMLHLLHLHACCLLDVDVAVTCCCCLCVFFTDKNPTANANNETGN